jgi:transcriptional regulator with XRE-family HTH domain
MERDYEQLRKDLARNVKALRGERGLSQEALALSADVDRTYVSQIERAVGNPSLLVLSKLGGILQVDVLELLGGQDGRGGQPALVIAAKFPPSRE